MAARTKAGSTAKSKATPKSRSKTSTRAKKATGSKAASRANTTKKKSSGGGPKNTVRKSRENRKQTSAGEQPSRTDNGGYSDPSHWEKHKEVVKSEQPLMKTLYAEHRHMAGVMQLLGGQLDTIAAGELIDPHLVYEIMDYMVTWPDRFHHPREDLIYARVAELDAGAIDEVDTLQRDHDETAKLGQQLLRAVENWRSGDLTGDKLVVQGRDYIAHIFDHMRVEEQLVFPHIDSVLSATDWRELEMEDQLEAVSAPILGPMFQREFRNMARKMRRGVRRTVERQALEEWIDIEAFMESVEVVSMAYESSRHSAGEHFRSALQEAADIFMANPLTAPFKVAANNTRVGVDLLGEVTDISRETFQDLVKVNRERKDRVRLLHRNS